MKKRNIITTAVLGLTLAGYICGCGSNTAAKEPQQALQQTSQQTPQQTLQASQQTQTQQLQTQSDMEQTKVDLDLTELSSTMIYSEVFHMMTKPDDYMGKTIRMEGVFSVYHDDASDKNYYACVVQDATACCAQGIEFVLNTDYTYPEDYPQPEEVITVQGVFDVYSEGENKYCTLRDAVWLK